MMTGSILSYRQEDSVRLLCEIDLKKLFSTPKETERFNEKWNDFVASDRCNKDVFDLKGDRLKYQSEHLSHLNLMTALPCCLSWETPPAIPSKKACFIRLQEIKKSIVSGK